MHARRGRFSFLASLVLVASSVGSCGPAGATPSAVPATGGPGPSVPSPTSAAVLQVEVVPARVVGLALPGEKLVFMVRTSGGSTDPVKLAATAAGADVSVSPASITAGDIAEVTVVPGPVTGDEATLDVDITAEQGSVVRTERRTFTVHPGQDDLRAEADAHLAPFLAWLGANRPDLGISPATTLEPMPGTWVLIVSHYLYFSSDWEIDLSWHVMIAPDDWSRINMRRRWTELQPSCAFEISSVSGATMPREITPEDAVWR